MRPFTPVPPRRSRPTRRPASPASFAALAAFVVIGLAAGATLAAPPKAQDDAFTTWQNHGVIVPLLDNDRDPDGDMLLLDAIVDEPAHGKVGTHRQKEGLVDPVDGSPIAVYKPAKDFTGRDSFTYRVTDGQGGTDTARVVIEVRPGQPVPAAPNPAALDGRNLDVLVIGDSNTEGGDLTGGIAKVFEEHYGYFGSGYRSFIGTGDHWKSDVTSHYFRIRQLKGWEQKRLTARQSPSQLASISKEPGATATIDFYGTAIDVYYLNVKNGGSITLQLDEQPVRTVNTSEGAGDQPTVAKVSLDGLEADWHRLQVEHTAGEVTMLGLESRVGVSTDQPRAVVHNWGCSAASTQHFADVHESVHVSALEAVQPDMVVILLGTNDHNMFGHGYAMLGHNTALIAERVRAAAPEAKLLISSTLAFGTRGQSDLTLKSYLKHWPELAESLGAAYWDMWSYMGGDKVPHYWSYATKPRIHFSPEGGYLIARKMHEVLRELGPTPAPNGALTRRAGTPGNLPHLGHIGFWLAGDGPVRLDDQGRVAEWQSIRGQSSAVQRIPAARPRLVEDAFNGRPALRFDGENDLMLLEPPRSIRGFAVVVRAAEPGGVLFGEGRVHYTMFGPGEDGNIYSADAAKKSTLYLNGGKIDGTRTVLPTDGPVILTCVLEDHRMLRLIGHNQWITDKYSDNIAQHLAYWNGDILEVIGFVNTNVTDDHRRQAEQYLSEKYGIPLVAGE